MSPVPHLIRDQHLQPMRLAVQKTYAAVMAAILLASVPAIVRAGTEMPPRPRIGLALSGGGAKGLAHIGVLKVLEEAGIPIDVVAGTSMGAVIGALYATGYTPQDIEEIAIRLDWQALFSDEPEYDLLAMVEKQWYQRYVGTLNIHNLSLQLPSGLVEGQGVINLLNRLTWPVHHVDDFAQLPTPFVCVATDIETGEAVPLRRGFLPLALRASMAIPSVFTPVQLDGRLLVDGGLSRNLPAEEARSLGAQVIIGVDVGAPLRTAESLTSFVDILDQAMSLPAARENLRQRGLCDVLITPELGDLSFSSFDQAERLIQAGEKAARQALPRIRQVADSLGIVSNHGIRRRAAMAAVDSIYITRVHIQGLRRISRGFVLGQMGLRLPQWLTAKALQRRIDLVYSTQFFDHVFYRLQPASRGTELTLHVSEKERAQLHFSFYYDTHIQSVLLLNTTFRNPTGHNSLLSVDGKLGGVGQLEGRYLQHIGLPYRLGLALVAGAVDSVLDRYRGRVRESRFRVRSLYGMVGMGTYFSNRWLVETGIGAERTRLALDVGTPDTLSQRMTLIGPVARVILDSRDRRLYPRRGQHLVLEATAGLRSLGSLLSYQRYRLHWEAAVALSPRVSLVQELDLGLVTGADPLPRYKRWHLGGATQFPGLDFHERSGRSLQAYRAGLFVEFRNHRFVLTRIGMGNAFADWRWPKSLRHYIIGVELSAGALTPIGPVGLSITTSREHAALVFARVGFSL